MYAVLIVSFDSFPIVPKRTNRYIYLDLELNLGDYLFALLAICTALLSVAIHVM